MNETERSYKIGNSEVVLRIGSILESLAQIYVSSDDNKFSQSGGVSLAISEAAGSEIAKELQRKVGQHNLGDIVITSAGNLPQEYIIHGVTRIDGSGAEAIPNEKVGATVRRIVNNSLDLVSALGLKSIAFPAIGTGYAGFGPKDVAVAMADVCQRRLPEFSSPLRVELVLQPQSLPKDLDFMSFFVEFEKAASWEEIAVRENTLVLVHGIRTDANWFQTTRRIFWDYDPTIHVVDAGYGFFDLFRFLLPIERLRASALETVEAKILRAHDHPTAKTCSIIAHSFGTYLVGRVLEKNARLKIRRIILCGSVVPTNYPWATLLDQIPPIDSKQYPTQIALNDCGWRDIWPVMARTCTWGYGASGRFGFKAQEVVDRFFDKRHSDFFDPKFVKDYWCPFISRGEVVRTEKDSPPAGWVLQLLTVVKVPILLLVMLLFIFFYRAV